MRLILALLCLVSTANAGDTIITINGNNNVVVVGNRNKVRINRSRPTTTKKATPVRRAEVVYAATSAPPIVKEKTCDDYAREHEERVAAWKLGLDYPY